MVRSWFLGNGDCKSACYDLIKKKNAVAKKDAKVNNDTKCDISSGEESAADSDDAIEKANGTLHTAASSVLMKIRCAARMARPDLLRSTTRLSSYDTKWSPYRGTPLHPLVCYIWSMLELMPEGCSSQRASPVLQVASYSDADFAGCVGTQRSTTGGRLRLEGPSSHAPIHSLSRRQDSTASSTPEAEMVDAGAVLRQMRLLSLDIWEVWLPKGDNALRGILREDNVAAINVIQSGRNPTMRCCHTVHGVSINRIHEIAGKNVDIPPFVDVMYTPPSDNMKACSFPNVFTNAATFEHVLKHIAVVKQAHIAVVSQRARLRNNTPVALPCVPTFMASQKDPKYPQGKPPPRVVESEIQPRVRRRAQFEP